MSTPTPAPTPGHVPGGTAGAHIEAEVEAILAGFEESQPDDQINALGRLDSKLREYLDSEASL